MKHLLQNKALLIFGLIVILYALSFKVGAKRERSSPTAISQVFIVGQGACCAGCKTGVDQVIRNDNSSHSISVTVQSSWTDSLGNAQTKTETDIVTPAGKYSLGCTSNCPGNCGTTYTYTIKRAIVSASYH